MGSILGLTGILAFNALNKVFIFNSDDLRSTTRVPAEVLLVRLLEACAMAAPTSSPLIQVTTVNPLSIYKRAFRNNHLLVFTKRPTETL